MFVCIFFVFKALHARKPKKQTWATEEERGTDMQRLSIGQLSSIIAIRFRIQAWQRQVWIIA